MSAKRDIAAFAAGLVFAVGLLLSGMTQPAKIVAFLDVAGAWDPSLALVMGGAVVVSAIAFRVARTRAAAPVLASRFVVPPARGPIRPRLVGGAILFGIGWGISGFCPGPAVVAVASGAIGPVVFVASMLVGMMLERFVRARSFTSATSTRLAP